MSEDGARVLCMSELTRLSKSRFCAGLQCPKQLWWRVHEPDAPELEAGPELQAIFDRGNGVGEAARERFPGGVLVKGEYWELREKVEQTRRALAEGAPVIYEASFSEDDVFVAVDVLERRRRGYRLIEVKSTLDVKEPHIPDVAIQVHVLRRAGLDVRRAEVMHLNRQCHHPDLSNLFVREDVTRKVKPLLPAIPGQVRGLQRMLAGPLPDTEPGDQCTSPYECPFMGRCVPEVAPDHITQLHGLRSKRVAELLAEGVRTIDDLPEGIELPATARRQVECLQTGKLVVDDALAEALADIAKPIAFLDFETINPAIPVWPGCRPYSPVPVQMSCHVLGPRGKLVHHAFLADGPEDPRPALAEAVVSACAGAATVLSYGAGFERRCIEDMARAVPRRERKLLSVASRLVDLLTIVRDHVYHPRFGGGFGLKAVLPALVRGLGYGDLDIAAGDTASAALEALLLEGDSMSARGRSKMRAQLLAYCERDTFGMVRLVERLHELA
jgi:predicted RecB family nuclease